MNRKPLHERLPALGRTREALRARFFDVLGRAAATDDGRRILHDAAGAGSDPPHGLGLDPAIESPYADLGHPQDLGPCMRDDIVFITARFRSGSTLFWNLFREIPSCTAYYEPFNERRWFDAAHRRSHTDPTHRGVSDYWREYEPLPHLGDLYREEWIERGLFMGEHAWDPGMKAYLAAMIERAPGRPILQCNRIDFRLPWIRRHFPRATVLHLYRHPRDVWVSTLTDAGAYPASASMDDFTAADHYYLVRWAMDLRHAFPFLDPAAHDHAYPLFYLVWKLSYLFGRRFAHGSLAYEDLVTRPEEVMADLADRLSLPDADPARLAGLVDPPRPGKWRAYAPEEWFAVREERCEQILADFLAASPQVRADVAADRVRARR